MSVRLVPPPLPEVTPWPAVRRPEEDITLTPALIGLVLGLGLVIAYFLSGGHS